MSSENLPDKIYQLVRDEMNRNRGQSQIQPWLFFSSCVGYGLTLNETVAFAKSEKLFEGWSDDEIASQYEQCAEAYGAGHKLTLRNFTEDETQGPSGKSKVTKKPRRLARVVADVREYTRGCPYRVDNLPFVDDAIHGLHFFDRSITAAVFGWLQSQFRVEWCGGVGFVTKDELVAELVRTAKRFDAIEVLPHEPSIEGIYYRGSIPAAGDGKYLRALLNRFSPDTTIDRQLLEAMFVTPLWGGPAGCRPSFVITSDFGRGSGKTKCAESVGRLYGGLIDISAGESIEVVKQRLLSPDGQTKRVSLIDNVKSLNFSWAELEAHITAQTISGKRMYVGEGQRPNLLTTLITLNGVALSTDMAQRSVIIKLDKPDNDGKWWEDTCRFIDENRDAIIGDIVAVLRSPQKPLAEYSRWATWEQHVLSRMPDPQDCQGLILARQGEADCGLEEADLIEAHFSQRLKAIGFDPQTESIRIPVALAREWHEQAIAQKISAAASGRKLKQMSKERQLTCLALDPGHNHGRCYIWTGPKAKLASEIDNTLTLKRVGIFDE
jgi:hypothetical protein